MSVSSIVKLAIAAAFAIAAASAVRADDGAVDDVAVPVRGVVKTIDDAALSTDLAARVSKIGFRTGESFKTGDLLVAFECDRYRAEAQAADAVWREMQLTADSNTQLEKFSAVGRHDVDIARARVAKAEAEARSLNSRVKQCEIFAPFDGRVAELSINVYEQPPAGRPFLRIVGNGRYEIELIVPSQWLTWLKPNSPFAFKSDETGRDYPARVSRIGAIVDTVSQMVKVIAAFDAPPADIIPGMSGVAHFTETSG